MPGLWRGCEKYPNILRLAFRSNPWSNEPLNLIWRKSSRAVLPFVFANQARGMGKPSAQNSDTRRGHNRLPMQRIAGRGECRMKTREFSMVRAARIASGVFLALLLYCWPTKSIVYISDLPARHQVLWFRESSGQHGRENGLHLPSVMGLALSSIAAGILLGTARARRGETDGGFPIQPPVTQRGES